MGNLADLAIRKLESIIEEFFWMLPNFGFAVPVAVPGVDPAILDPRSTWADPRAYDAQARRLVPLLVLLGPLVGSATAQARARPAPRRRRRARALRALALHRHRQHLLNIGLWPKRRSRVACRRARKGQRGALTRPQSDPTPLQRVASLARNSGRHLAHLFSAHTHQRTTGG